MRYIIKRISNRAEINKEIHPHQLRHSYATVEQWSSPRSHTKSYGAREKRTN